jgi:hypothetical protein
MDCAFSDGAKFISNDYVEGKLYFTKDMYDEIRDNQLLMDNTLKLYEAEILAWLTAREPVLVLIVPFSATALQANFTALAVCVPYVPGVESESTLVDYNLLQRIMLNEQNFVERRKYIIDTFDILKDGVALGWREDLTNILSFLYNETGTSYNITADSLSKNLYNVVFTYAPTVYGVTLTKTQEIISGKQYTVEHWVTTSPVSDFTFKYYKEGTLIKNVLLSGTVTGGGTNPFVRLIAEYTWPYTVAITNDLKNFMASSKWDLNLDKINTMYFS